MRTLQVISVHVHMSFPWLERMANVRAKTLMSSKCHRIMPLRHDGLTNSSSLTKLRSEIFWQLKQRRFEFNVGTHIKRQIAITRLRTRQRPARP